jgi:hypothetical protein
MLKYFLGSDGAETKATWLGAFGKLPPESFPLEELPLTKETF